MPGHGPYTASLLDISPAAGACRRSPRLAATHASRPAHASGRHPYIRPYRLGYGVLDENLHGAVDQGEKKVYFEFSEYSTAYIFYENPRYSAGNNGPTLAWRGATAALHGTAVAGFAALVARAGHRPYWPEAL
jgi:hypothetical protein